MTLRESQRLRFYIYAAEGLTGGDGQSVPVHAWYDQKIRISRITTCRH